MKSFASACIIFTIYITASLQETPFVPCKGQPMPLELRVEECVDSLPCIFHPGSDVIADIDFLANANATSVKSELFVGRPNVPSIVPIKYPGSYNTDVCKSLSNGTCPLNKTDRATYNFKMHIPNFTHIAENYRFQLQLVDENNNVHMCFYISSKII